MDWLGPLLGVFTGLAVLAFGGLMTYVVVAYVWHDLREWRDAIASRNWLETLGRIEAAQVESEGRIRTRLYYPRIRFSYSAEGQQYVGTRWRFASTWTEGHYECERAEMKLGPYPVGASVAVYYDPRQPQRATLERGWPAVWPWPVDFILAFFSYGVVWVGWNVMREAVLELLRAFTAQ